MENAVVATIEAVVVKTAATVKVAETVKVDVTDGKGGGGKDSGNDGRVSRSRHY
jgi:hypothetical protein